MEHNWRQQIESQQTRMSGGVRHGNNNTNKGRRGRSSNSSTRQPRIHVKSWKSVRRYFWYWRRSLRSIMHLYEHPNLVRWRLRRRGPVLFHSWHEPTRFNVNVWRVEGRFDIDNQLYQQPRFCPKRELPASIIRFIHDCHFRHATSWSVEWKNP